MITHMSGRMPIHAARIEVADDRSLLALHSDPMTARFFGMVPNDTISYLRGYRRCTRVVGEPKGWYHVSSVIEPHGRQIASPYQTVTRILAPSVDRYR
jgi:hypothetical protein